MVSTSGGPNLSIAAACIMGTGAFLAKLAFFALTGDRFVFLAVVALVFPAALRLPLEGLLTRFFEAFFCVFEALPRAFFFFVAIFTCSLFVRSA
jgi:hypothetical protein